MPYSDSMISKDIFSRVAVRDGARLESRKFNKLLIVYRKPVGFSFFDKLTLMFTTRVHVVQVPFSPYWKNNSKAWIVEVSGYCLKALPTALGDPDSTIVFVNIEAVILPVHLDYILCG